MVRMVKRLRMKGMGRAVFAEHVEAIRAELAAHMPIKACWEKRRAVMGLSYGQFVAYVHEFIGKPGANAAAPRPRPVLREIGQAPAAEPVPPAEAPPSPSRFRPASLRKGEKDG
jgi:hypothetical protein